MKIVNNTLIRVTPKDIHKGTFVIPDGVTSIGIHAFYGCSALTSVTIPDSVTSIGNWAFSGCSCLTSVTLSNSMTYIGDGTFYGCQSLTDITIPDSVTKIHRLAFVNCEKLININIPNTVTYIGSEVFANCDGLVSKPANYKAFCYDRPQLRCRNKDFHINKRGWAKGKIELCKNGIHFCTNLFDIFNYYYGSYGTEFVIALCDVSDEQDKIGAAEAADSKRCARWVRPTHILTREELIALLNNPIKGGEKQ